MKPSSLCYRAAIQTLPNHADAFPHDRHSKLKVSFAQTIRVNEVGRFQSARTRF
jgi:hypothetical protein